jgi:negative regulator of sigma E activity
MISQDWQDAPCQAFSWPSGRLPEGISKIRRSRRKKMIVARLRIILELDGAPEVRVLLLRGSNWLGI